MAILAGILAVLAGVVEAEELKPRVLLGPWRCNSYFQNEQVAETLTFAATTYQSMVMFHNQQIIVDGGYTAEPAGENALTVSYQPFNWRPRLLCTGPGGVGGSCGPLNFPPRIDQLFFVRPDIFQVRQGMQLVACYKQK